MNLSRPVIVYISAASDLMVEREALARMIAELPVSVVWQVLQTPVDIEPLHLDLLPEADLHVLVMGTDIRAPVGLEWHVAHRADRPTAAFLKQSVARTPAGRIFVHDAGAAWRLFTDAADLSRKVQRLLAEHMLRHADRYVLTPVELTRLDALLKSEAEAELPTEAEGAGRSAVILSRERYVPSEGVPLEEG